MKTSIQEKKQKALELLKQLDICEDYVELFKKKDIVTYFEQYIGYWAFQEEDLMARIKAFEEKWNALVFAVTHEYAELPTYAYGSSFPKWSCYPRLGWGISPLERHCYVEP